MLGPLVAWRLLRQLHQPPAVHVARPWPAALALIEVADWPWRALQAVTRLQTHFSNVDAVIGYYKDVMVTVGCWAAGLLLLLPPLLGLVLVPPLPGLRVVLRAGARHSAGAMLRGHCWRARCWGASTAALCSCCGGGRGCRPVDTADSDLACRRSFSQIDGNRSMDAVFDSIRTTMDELQAGVDPMEVFCADNPAADECRVYE
jgi:hypothetical protein